MNEMPSGWNTETARPVDAGTPALEVRHVSKAYYPPSRWLLRARADARSVKHALHGLSLCVRAGEMVALLGPNGAGKTTLLKIIATLIHPSSGQVRLFGADVRDDPYLARSQMGLVTCDERSFYWRLTGRQNLNFFGALYGLSKRQIAERGDEILETLDLVAAADRPYHSYSSGMKQKLAIARGLLSYPRMLIYDEPTRSLDPLSANNIRRWIQGQRDRFPQQTHVLATNQLHEAEMLCDRVVIINGGELVAQGTVAEIRAMVDVREFASYRISVRERRRQIAAGTFGSTEVTGLRVEQTAEGVDVLFTARRESNALTSVLSAIIGAGGSIVECATEQSSFDEVFCSVIGAEQKRRVAL